MGRHSLQSLHRLLLLFFEHVRRGHDILREREELRARRLSIVGNLRDELDARLEDALRGEELLVP